jgi:integrase/recombinase XerC
LAEYELIAYRQHMVAAGRRPATVNRRLDALRRLCRWARGTGALNADAAGNVRPMRTVRNRQPVGLTDVETHALLRAAGAASHGLAARNYALVQVMLQAGLRVGEVAALTVADISMSDRSGSVRIRQARGSRRATSRSMPRRGARSSSILNNAVRWARPWRCSPAAGRRRCRCAPSRLSSPASPAAPG